jgi:bifunctional DNase/RNase
MSDKGKELEVKIRALIVDPNSGSPVLVLRDTEGEGMVPIWVGACEANAIASAIENLAAPRPMTHDLLRNLINQMGYEVVRVTITELKDNTYFSLIQLIDEAGNSISLDARPSDAIALALRCGCPIFVQESILAEQSKASDEGESSRGGTTGDEDWPEVLDDAGGFSM